jgi:hypothetical protein
MGPDRRSLVHLTAPSDRGVGASSAVHSRDFLSVFQRSSYTARRPCGVNPGVARTTERIKPVFQHTKKVLVGVAALAAIALGGSAIADATTSHSTTQTSPGAPAPTGWSTQRPPAFRGPAHGTAAHEDAEKPVTGAAAAKAKAAAVKATGGGTAGAVTTDLTGKGYETTVTKSDGSKVEVHLDSSYHVFQGPGGPGGPPPGSYGG